MQNAALATIDTALDEYADHLPSDSLTFQSIVREDAWNEIASYARGEGYFTLADLLEKAEGACYFLNAAH